MSQPSALTVATALCVALAGYGLFKRQRNAARLPLPPGPKKLPFIGNLLDLPTSEEWVTYEKWCREFETDIIHLEVVGKSIVIINSFDTAIELLEKRSSYYSGRAHLTMASDLMGWKHGTALLTYGDEWRMQRRFIHGTFNATEAVRLRPHEVLATHNLLRRLMKDPNDIMKHLLHWAGDIVLRITYGIDVLDENDPYVAAAEAGVRAFFAAAMPGAYLVDTFPILKYVPKWMPGAGFKRKAEEWAKYTHAIYHDPFEETQRRMANGDPTPSLTSLSLQKVNPDSDVQFQRDAIMNAAGSMYGAGTDTTVSAVSSCILAMLENPEILRKAQEQIDSVIGRERLPTFDDQDQLPYITALAKESLRWRAITPIGVPHLVEKDDTYGGYFIPGNSVVISNIGAILHDKKVYPDPMTFKPERFLKEDGQLDLSVRDPALATFGFGRRICPGRYMAFSSIWIVLASLVATFDFKKAVDEDGNVIPLSHRYLPGLAVLPASFECMMSPRSEKAAALIAETVGEAFE